MLEIGDGNKTVIWVITGRWTGQVIPDFWERIPRMIESF